MRRSSWTIAQQAFATPYSEFVRTSRVLFCILVEWYDTVNPEKKIQFKFLTRNMTWTHNGNHKIQVIELRGKGAGENRGR